MSDDSKILYAAWNYYHNNLTQSQIAKRMHVSRATVGRLLEKARRDGIVQIKITKPLPKYLLLEEQFLSRFNFSEVVIVEPSINHQNTCESVAQAAAELLSSLLFPGCKLGLARSRTASNMANYLEISDNCHDIYIHELVGTFLDSRTEFAISWRVADKLGAQLNRLPVPGVVKNSSAREAILKEDSIRNALSNARNVDIAFVGLGSADQDSSLIKTNYMSIPQMSEMSRKGAVGEVLMRFYDLDGNHVSMPELEERIIGLNWTEIRQVDRVIALATGANKVNPIIGAINSGIIEGLVTDIETAETVLAYYEA